MSSKIDEIQDRIGPFLPTLEVLHLRSMLRELWDAVHTALAANPHENLEAYLDEITRCGVMVNEIIIDEIASMVISAHVRPDEVMSDSPITLEERAAHEKAARKRHADMKKKARDVLRASGIETKPDED